MDRAEETRAKLCAVLCGAATAAMSVGEISAATEEEVVAPKDKN
jgi:hypothetical protein